MALEDIFVETSLFVEGADYTEKKENFHLRVWDSKLESRRITS